MLILMSGSGSDSMWRGYKRITTTHSAWCALNRIELSYRCWMGAIKSLWIDKLNVLGDFVWVLKSVPWCTC